MREWIAGHILLQRGPGARESEALLLVEKPQVSMDARGYKVLQRISTR